MSENEKPMITTPMATGAPAPRNKSLSALGRDTNSNDSNSVRRRVFVGNLAVDKASKRDVGEIFSKFGEIESISLHNNFGFIQYCEESGADEAVLQMHGKELFGKRIDVNLAGLRRKAQIKDKVEGKPEKEMVVPPHMMNAGASLHPRKRPRSRSPIQRPRDNPYRRPSSPMTRYEEPYRKDEPFHRFEPYERPLYNPRDYPPERDVHRHDYPPPYERNCHPSDDMYRRTADYRHARSRPAIDCEIVSLSKEESRYAEEVESRLRGIGLACNIGYPPPEIPIHEAVDRVARMGTLYAVVVAPQNAIHRSCTLNILHGARQEHRNMPLDDCLSLVAKNFDTYLRFLRDPYRGPPHPYSHEEGRLYGPPPHPPPVGSEKKMSNDELSSMIEKLKREKEQREIEQKIDGRRVDLEGQLRDLRQEAAGQTGYPTQDYTHGVQHSQSFYQPTYPYQ